MSRRQPVQRSELEVRRDEAGSASPTPTPDSRLPTPAVTGVVGDAAATRSGEDARRRGWFWHWNSIVTQYAPLIGLKGVGLLNSYTVWTDRREESPHRGFAFPSQQSEADFYGEDRAELIAINKILVALDLIEIRKEMVLRVDEQGRRWRVPHNFYRVKDHGDGFVLGGGDVLRVAELADRDQAVYRLVKHIFSTRFAPIDPDNVWVRILAELRPTDLWRRLAARTARAEDRASARTRAGHAARKAGFGAPNDSDTATTELERNDSAGVAIHHARETTVAPINTGSEIDVGGTNTGSTDEKTSVVAPINRGMATSVEPGNRTYNQSDLTTTTTDVGRNVIGRGTIDVSVSRESAQTPAPQIGVPDEHDDASRSLTGEPKAAAAGPGGAPAPFDAGGETTAVNAFEDANARRATPAERQILRGIAERFDPAARGQTNGADTGWSWVAAAIYEAVESGSAYVAPRRVREILNRWEREGDGGEEASGRGGEANSKLEARSSKLSSPPSRLPASSPPSPDFALPHGFGSRRTWEFTIALLGATMDREKIAELTAGTAITGYADGEVTIAVPDAVRAERIAGEYRDLFTRKLSEAMRRPVRLAAFRR